MNDGMSWPRCCAINNHVLMNLHVGHGDIRIAKAAFKVATALAEQREFPQTGAAVLQLPAKEKLLQR